MENTKNLENDNELKIIVYGEPKSGKSLLCKIIKECLERDYEFRTLFKDKKILISEVNKESKNNLVEK